MEKNITGYKVGKLIGTIWENDDKSILILSEYSDDNPCDKCLFYCKDDKECSYDEERSVGFKCLRERYYYKRNAPIFNYKSRIITLDMKKISDSCRDFCVFYEKNCYNKHKDDCIIRMLENDKYDSHFMSLY